MDEKPDQIIEHIEARRDELGRNLSELESKVRRTTDWHTYYDKNPMLILGAALGGGVLLGAAIGGATSRSRTKGIRTSRYKPATGTSGKTGRSGSYSSSGYYTPAEATSSSFAGLGSSTGTASHRTPPESGTSSSTSDTSSSSGPGTIQNLGTKLQSLAGGQMHQVNEAIDHVRGALIAFGITKVKEFLSQSVPGLEQHFMAAGNSGHSGSGSYSDSPDKGANPSGMSSTGSKASDYRSGAQNYPGGSASYGTGSSLREGNTGPSASTNSGRASEADDYAGAGSRTSTPRQTP